MTPHPEGPRPDAPHADAIPDKRTYEQAIADDLAAKLRAFDPDMGEYAITVVGSYPDTKLKVSGRNIRTGRPTEWEFALWKFWDEWGTVNGTSTVIYAQLAD